MPDFIVNWSGRGHKYSPEEIETVVRVMSEADPLTQGRHQAEFEERFAEYLGAKHCFAVSNCTAALELSAILSGIGPGDEVVVPAHTFAASAIPFARTGARLVWCDIDPGTWVMTESTVRSVLTDRTKVIVAVHLYGISVDLDPIMELARSRGIQVVEDAAQAPGGTYRSRKVGAIGDFSCFSFHTHKNMTTLGEGGMLVVRDEARAKMVPGLRHNGMRPFAGPRERYWVPAMTDVDFDIEGFWPYNFCLGEVQCALGTRLLDRLDDMNRERDRRARLFRDGLADLPEIQLQRIPEGCGHTHHLMPLRFRGERIGKTRDQFMEAVIYREGIKAVVQYYPLYRYPMFQRAGFGQADCPHTDEFFDNMVSFPFHHWLSETDLEKEITAIGNAVRFLRRN